jgi:hypothetical protein
MTELTKSLLMKPFTFEIPDNDVSPETALFLACYDETSISKLTLSPVTMKSIKFSTMTKTDQLM